MNNSLTLQKQKTWNSVTNAKFGLKGNGAVRTWNVDVVQNSAILAEQIISHAVANDNDWV